ncbi:MarR family winged helix-turn-helix transcriptional regulator [Anianabacter salinae]|uniref:MarR family winged helix-turn-helix transcriptional regulator n=1 Tax=Anianabacter salinae TaxID=2851023 RepID=UPI00225DD87E|nr:MarR family transcriptional regulator [Anianabacter salinae]MBV0911142.1 MarR family transcriptional regulator [Anianabacter salinae]
MARDTETEMTAFEARKVDLERSIFARMFRASHAARKQGQKILQQISGLSVVEWRIIWDLHEVGPLRISELAELIGIDRSLVSRALPAMEKAGLVTLTRGASDARQVIVRLTDAGEDRYAQCTAAMGRRRADAQKAFTAEELDLFLSFLDRFEVVVDQPPELYSRIRE